MDIFSCVVDGSSIFDGVVLTSSIGTRVFDLRVVVSADCGPVFIGVFGSPGVTGVVFVRIIGTSIFVGSVVFVAVAGALVDSAVNVTGSLVTGVVFVSSIGTSIFVVNVVVAVVACDDIGEDI